MEWPDAWVVCVVLKDNVASLSFVREGATRTYDLHIASLGVLLVRDSAVPDPGTFREHVEVVAVQMHGVGGGEKVVHD